MEKETIFCHYCGAELLKEAAFCDKCGKATKEIAQEAKAVPAVEPSKTTPPPPPPKKHLSMFIAIVPVAIIAVIGIAVAVYFYNKYKAVDEIIFENIESEDEIVQKKESFTDARDGKKYKYVTIDKQTWMAENLNYNASGSKCYGEGGKAIVGWRNTATDTKPIKDTLSNDEIQANCNKYGRLYNWTTAKTVCPSGWHLPNKAEWEKLFSFVENVHKSAAGEFLRPGKDWHNYGKDTYGFSALPGGYGTGGHITGGFDLLAFDFAFAGVYGYWWSTEHNEYNAYGWSMVVSNAEVKYDTYPKDIQLLSVRCLKNTETKQATYETKQETQAEAIDESFCARASSPAEKAYCTGQSLEEFLGVLGEAEIKPSFDCAKASTPAEKTICSNANLAELDNRLAEAYKKARSACKTDVKQEQKEWLKKMSSCTSNVKCLENSYKTRIQELESCR